MGDIALRCVGVDYKKENEALAEYLHEISKVIRNMESPVQTWALFTVIAGRKFRFDFDYNSDMGITSLIGYINIAKSRLIQDYENNTDTIPDPEIPEDEESEKEGE